ncbi:MAG TPA: DUF6266 family protein [Spirochaetota bacterium]|nr:DUF6266 family protein [Spirochaetota bacterium]
MAKIKLDTMLAEVNSRVGNVVYSEWKGIKYIRRYVKADDANTETQVEIRSTFSKTVALWRLIPDSLKTGWDIQTKNKPLTGYNLFFKRNFDAVREGQMLELSRGGGLTEPWNLSAAINSSGEISVSFELDQSAGNASVFIQRVAETDRKRLIISKLDVTGSGMPVVFSGFNPAEKYFVYVVATETGMNNSLLFSDSVACEVTAV